MVPTLYHIPKTISSPIYQVLIELDLVDNPIHVKILTFDDLKTPEYRAINPMGTCPAFTDHDQGIVMWESGAVLAYILDVYDTKRQLVPSISADSNNLRAKYLQLKQYILATVYPFMASLYIHTLKPIEEQDPAYIKASEEKWRRFMAPVLVAALGDSEYFVGGKISAVDFIVVKPLGNAESLGVLVEFPTLYALWRRMTASLSYATAYNVTALDECIACRSLALVPEEAAPIRRKKEE